MLTTQEAFIEFACRHQVLRFGEFKLKSGRISPYFFNTGYFSSGESLLKLGDYYAQTIIENKLEFDTLFGTAYKGIPIASATAIALADKFHRNATFCFNRKETKDHGEGGEIVGGPLGKRVLLLDDVITAGTAFRSSKQIIEAHQASIVAIVIALDRQECSPDHHSTIGEIRDNYGIPVFSIATLDDVVDYLNKKANTSKIINQIKKYQDQYGVK